MTLSREFIIGLVSGTIAALIGAIVGAILVGVWDLWKESRRESREHQRAVRLLQSEITANLALLEGNRNNLSKDTDAAKENKEVVPPLPVLFTSAWESVHLAGSLSDNQRLVDELAQTYNSIMILNQRIQARELYRSTNQSMDNYARRRILINQELLNQIDVLLPRLQDHLQALK